jgi:hypothetical protein
MRTASGRFGVLGPFGFLTRSRKGFHAEGAEPCAQGSHVRFGPRRTRSVAEGSLHRTLEDFEVVDEEEPCADTAISTPRPFYACRSPPLSA